MKVDECPGQDWASKTEEKIGKLASHETDKHTVWKILYENLHEKNVYQYSPQVSHARAKNAANKFH